MGWCVLRIAIWTTFGSSLDGPNHSPPDRLRANGTPNSILGLGQTGFLDVRSRVCFASRRLKICTRDPPFPSLHGVFLFQSCFVNGIESIEPLAGPSSVS